MNLFLRLAGVSAALSVAACAANGYCLSQQRYDHAASVPPIHGGEGLEVPSAPTALKVPPAPAVDVPYGARVPDPQRPGHTKIECLDQPPPMPSPQALAGAPQ
ncbi:MAG TPA: hypothetical protein VFA70_00920 [Dehalococcoidia bacterium]|nr:hypothetical protein [Nevskia sp.]MDI3259990.1 hypothetical protein [Nevskiaceae bacterium]HZU75294.1 hypothetical protein [Dehalococcoidia bacterium]